MGASRPEFRTVIDHIAAIRPEVLNPAAVLAEGRVIVDGRIITNPKTLVRSIASLRILPLRPLRGEEKLRAALDGFAIEVAGKVALDLGAAAGGFTTVLLERGSRRAYAVDVGFGQLRGVLRADPRVVSLERTNLSELTRQTIPDRIDLVTMDLSYVSVADAAGQMEPLEFAPDADLVAVVKPMFELRLAGLPQDPRVLRKALAHAVRGIVRTSWHVEHTMASPVRGSRGAHEWLVHARRR